MQFSFAQKLKIADVEIVPVAIAKEDLVHLRHFAAVMMLPDEMLQRVPVAIVPIPWAVIAFVTPPKCSVVPNHAAAATLRLHSIRAECIEQFLHRLGRSVPSRRSV